MKKTLKAYSLMLILCFNATVVALAQDSTSSDSVRDTSDVKKEESKLRITGEADFSNSYLWRGIVFNQGAVLQPTIDFYYKGLQITFWNNVSLYENEQHDRFSELDCYIAYEKELGSFYLQPALNFYSYPPYRQQAVTGEAAFFFGYYLGNLGIYTNPNYDFILNPGGFYVENGFNYEKETDKHKIELFLAHGIGNELFTSYNIGVTENDKPVPAYQLVKFDGSYRKNFSSGFYLRPHITCNYIFKGNIKDFFKKDNFNIGIATGFQF